MTKVKTILREFCSAKDILAINRLGLLSKGDERESQPVPWRHRLQRKERRELVRSEMRMNLRATDRLSTRDKARAITECHAPHNSRMGDYLIQQHCINTKAGGGAGVEVSRLTGEQRRSEQEMSQVKKTFLRQSTLLNREPLILVERPPSPTVRTRAKIMERHGVDPMTITLPSYMQPLRTKTRKPSTLTTIEAYTLQTRKKKNVWESAAEDKDGIKFKSMARPSNPLSKGERRQLKIGYNMHKPTQESIEDTRSKPQRSKTPVHQHHTSHAHSHALKNSPPRPKSTPGNFRGASPVFITEVASHQNNSPPKYKKTEAFTKTPSKAVRFSRELTEKKDTRTPSYPLPKASSLPLRKSTSAKGRPSFPSPVPSRSVDSGRKQDVSMRDSKHKSTSYKQQPVQVNNKKKELLAVILDE